jgi:surface protein
MFYHCVGLEELDLSKFDTGAVTEFYRMFSGCTQLKRVDLSSFNTSAATDMQEMFAECPALEDMDLSHFDVSNVKKFNNFMNHNKKVNGKPWLNMFGQF